MGSAVSDASSARGPVRVKLRVSPGAGANELVGRHGDAWKVRVAAPAERGRANDALLAFLAELLGIPRARVTLVAGASSRDKVVEVEGATRADVERQLADREGRG